MDVLTQLILINKGLDRRFEGGSDPFKIITRLAEECGELAKEVNHFEKQGVKMEKHGVPDKKHLAKEVQDVLRCALQIASYYEVEDLLTTTITEDYEQIKKEGWIS